MITEGPQDPNIFKVVFMSGIPGAGKSSVSKVIQKGTGLKMVNYDDIYEYFSKKNNIDHNKFSDLLNKKIQTYINGRLGMIIDKTSQNYRELSKLKDSLERLGYQTCMVYVNTDLDTAKQRVIKRYKETGRNVDNEYIDYVFKKLILNLGKFQKDFGNNLFIVDNTRQFNQQNIQKKINRFLNEPLNYIAKDWIENYSYKKSGSKNGFFKNM